MMNTNDIPKAFRQCKQVVNVPYMQQTARMMSTELIRDVMRHTSGILTNQAEHILRDELTSREQDSTS